MTYVVIAVLLIVAAAAFVLIRTTSSRETQVGPIAQRLHSDKQRNLAHGDD